MEIASKLVLLSTWMSLVNIIGAQLPMPAGYLPKDYFFPDGRRIPRHVQNDHYYSSSSNYHISPTASNPSSSNYGSYETSPVMSNEFGTKLNVDQKASANRRKLRFTRLPKSFRPPKEFIIYSLPEQSFWAIDQPQDDYVDQDLNKQHVPLGDKVEADVEPEIENEQVLSSKLDEHEASRTSYDHELEHQSKTSRNDGTQPINNNYDKELSLDEKKNRLGQCMRYCMDAIL